MKSYYDILEVPPDASPAALKASYRKLAMKYHPDKNPGAESEAKFKELGEAYDTLSDEARRREYDAMLSGERTGPGFAAGPRAGRSGDGLSVEDILRRFGDLFGGDFGPSFHQGRAAKRPGVDIATELELDFRTAVRGGKVDVAIGGEVVCSVCGGRGSRGPTRPCPTCQGSGRMTEQAREPGQFFTVTRACPSCLGTGHDSSDACENCRGRGVEEKTRRVSITIPAGVEPDRTLRLKGLGGAGANGGTAGDLLVTVRIRPDATYRREGDDLHTDVSVPVSTAALGGTIPLRTLKGEVELKVPPGSSSGRQLRLRGQGVRNGDLIAHVQIAVPKKLTARERQLYQELADLAGAPKPAP